MEANAARKSGRGSSSSSRQLSAAKARMISIIQQQIEAARKVLAAAESKAGMSQNEVTEALSSLSTIQSEIKSAELEVREATKALKATEEDIVKAQRPNSEFARSQAALEQAKDAAHLAIHRVLHLPPDKEDKPSSVARLSDLAHLTDAQRTTLHADASYQSAQKTLHDAVHQVEQIKHKLFQSDEDWVEAQKEFSESLKKLREEREQAKTTAGNSTKNRQVLQNAQSVAAAARAIIAQGEARLQLLSKIPSSRSRSSSRRR